MSGGFLIMADEMRKFPKIRGGDCYWTLEYGPKWFWSVTIFRSTISLEQNDEIAQFVAYVNTDS